MAYATIEYLFLNEDGIVDMSDVDVVMNNGLVNPISTEQEEQYIPASPNIQGITTYQIWLGDEIAVVNIMMQKTRIKIICR